MISVCVKVIAKNEKECDKLRNIGNLLKASTRAEKTKKMLRKKSSFKNAYGRYSGNSLSSILMYHS